MYDMSQSWQTRFFRRLVSIAVEGAAVKQGQMARTDGRNGRRVVFGVQDVRKRGLTVSLFAI